MNARCRHSIIGKSIVVFLWGWVLLSFLIISFDLQAQKSQDKIEVELSRQTNTIYNIFNQISRQTGYFFIYDSEAIDSDKEIRISKTKGSLVKFLRELLYDDSLEFIIKENHIVIRKVTDSTLNERFESKDSSKPAPIILEGRITDIKTGKPLPYSTISIKNESTGVITNQDGIFKFMVSQESLNDTVVISTLGYKNRYFPIAILKEGFIDISMDFEHILLPEITVISFDPQKILSNALSQTSRNYPNQASNHISFYREGIFREDDVMLYSEAVLKEYKPAYSSYQRDQIVPLQSRKISNINREDTLIFKLKAGLQSAEKMDMIRNIPDFLDDQFMRYYDYYPAGMTIIDDVLVYAIDFQQKEHVRDALHKGTIYIDKETLAIIYLDFEINQNYIRKIQSRFIPRPNPKFATTIQKASYRVGYKMHEDRYHINHVKGELMLRSRKRNRLSVNNYRIFFEKATIQIETKEVTRLRRRESIRKSVIFSDEDFTYDYDFWGKHNIILPEKRLSEALKLIDNKIESLVYE